MRTGDGMDREENGPASDGQGRRPLIAVPEDGHTPGATAIGLHNEPLAQVRVAGNPGEPI